MTRFVLSAQLGPQDIAPVEVTNSEQLVTLNFLDDAGVLRHGIGRALRDLKRLNLRPTATGIDLLVLAVLVYAADTRVNRAQASQDGWTREIRLVVPVSDPPRWDACRTLLSNTLRFLTGDLWAITFRQWPAQVPHPTPPDLGTLPSTSFDGVSLFSGGLDSLIGAIDSLQAGETPLFASHGADASVSSPQQQLFDSLARQYSAKAVVQRIRMGLRLNASLAPGMSPEDTTRGRSFLFFALGAMAGSSLGKAFRLRVPENGFISLNVPLDVTRLGSNSTRTTHPYYMHRWNELFKSIGLPCTVYNPYWNKTKGEMISDCSDPKGLEKLAGMSVSCSHPSYKRYAKDDKDHCGSCLPCIIRRASFASSPVKDPTRYRIEDLSDTVLDSTRAEGTQIRAIQYALSRIEENPRLAEIWIHKPGPLTEDIDKLQDLADVYARGMAEIRKVVGSSKAISSKAHG